MDVGDVVADVAVGDGELHELAANWTRMTALTTRMRRHGFCVRRDPNGSKSTLRSVVPGWIMSNGVDPANPAGLLYVSRLLGTDPSDALCRSACGPVAAIRVLRPADSQRKATTGSRSAARIAASSAPTEVAMASRCACSGFAVMNWDSNGS